MSTFSDLQATHEELVNKAQTSEEILEQVQQYLKDIQSGSSLVSSAQERDQLRANLRYWTSYVYEKTGEYPNVDLLPSADSPQKDRRVLFSFVGALAGGLLVLLSLFALGYFGFTFGIQLNPAIATFVVQTQIAQASVTPLPSAIPGYTEAAIVNTLNGVLQGANPLEETLDAKFSILDVGFDLSGNPPATTTIRFHVECEWVTRPSCTAERAFVVLADAFKAIKADVRKKLIEQIPSTIQIVQVRAFDHMNQIGIVEVTWECLLQFANDEITGDQLAARTTRFHTP